VSGTVLVGGDRELWPASARRIAAAAGVRPQLDLSRKTDDASLTAALTGCVVNSMTRVLPTSRCGDADMSPPAVTHVVTGQEESVQVVVRWKDDEDSGGDPPTNATAATGRVRVSGAPSWLDVQWQQVGYVWVNAPM